MPKTRTRQRTVKRGGQCKATAINNKFENDSIIIPRNNLLGGRRNRGLNRKSAKKVKRCLKKAAGKKSAKARRSATKKCMRLKKSLRKH
tara:strand:- start:7069 stop:7335 length:267 start_codon:yes stop_codon:yes gene_type:complete